MCDLPVMFAEKSPTRPGPRTILASKYIYINRVPFITIPCHPRSQHCVCESLCTNKAIFLLLSLSLQSGSRIIHAVTTLWFCRIYVAEMKINVDHASPLPPSTWIQTWEDSTTTAVSTVAVAVCAPVCWCRPRTRTVCIRQFMPVANDFGVNILLGLVVASGHAARGCNGGSCV